MKKFFCLTLIATGICGTLFAQRDYKNSMGVRIAPDSYYDVFAFSYKTFLNDAGAIELNAGIGNKSRYITNNLVTDKYHPFAVSISAGYQYHFNIPVEGLRWFIGGGLTGYHNFASNGNVNGLGFGFYPTGGVEWKIPAIPLVVGADYRPTIFFSRPDNYDSFYAGNFGISARYTFGGQ
jgi:hypothetical protein